MKKPTKSTTTGKAATTRNKRHAAGSSKPVTIDLKADKVEGSSDKSAAADKSPATSDAASSQKSAASATDPSKAAGPDSTETATSATKNDESLGKSGAGAKASTETKSSFGRPASTPPPDGVARSTPNAAPKKSVGWFGRLSAALVGGIVALAGAGLLQYVGVLGSPSDRADYVSREQLNTQTNALSGQIDLLKTELEKTSEAATDPSVGRAAVAALIDERLAELGQNQGGADTEGLIDQINQTTTRLEQLLADQQASAKSIADMEAAIRSGGGGDSAASMALSLELETLATRLDQSNGSIEELKSDIASLTNQSANAASETNSVAVGQLARLEAGMSTLAGLTESVSQLQARVEDGSRQLAAQGEKLEQVQNQLNKPDATERLAAGAVAAAALKSDIDRGLPFKQSLATLQRFAEGDEKLEALQPFSETGIPTRQTLQSEFQPVGDRILSAVQPVAGDSFTSRLSAAMKSFVKVKTTGPLEGSSPLAVVSQINDALQQGKLNQASRLWNTLPDEAKGVSADWHTRLESRIVADNLIDQAVQSFLNSSATQ